VECFLLGSSSHLLNPQFAISDSDTIEAAMPVSHQEPSDLEVESIVGKDSISLFEAYSRIGEAVKALNAIKREDQTTPSWKWDLTKAQEDLRSSTAVLGSHSRFSRSEYDKLWLDSINAQAEPQFDALYVSPLTVSLSSCPH
jgi:hypothetical protein